jgi:hypothetical protein
MVKKTGWFVFFALLAGACLDEPECFSLNNNIIGITFKNITDGTADTTTFESIKAEGIDGTFGATANKVYLPLNYFQDHTTFFFKQKYASGTTDLQSDTIELQYDAKVQFVSPDCGERFVLTNLTIVRHTFDSVRLVSAIPSNVAGGNQIEIFK